MYLIRLNNTLGREGSLQVFYFLFFLLLLLFFFLLASVLKSSGRWCVML